MRTITKFVFFATDLIRYWALRGVMMAFISTMTKSVDKGTSTVAGKWAIFLIGLAMLLFVLAQGKRRR